ncbi:hypothetical protein, partial [Mitsuokella jalaludinii]|uniref:hypothetical protein n=1 Tax=Mitsuokella jalaludinii TaxID=187979 RepID=UPI00298D3FCB
KNIWLESQMIHVALFSFQRTTLSFEALCFKRLLYLIASSGACQEVFSFFFQVLSAPAIPCQSRLLGSCRCRIAQRLVLYYRMADELSTAFLKKMQKAVESLISPLAARSRAIRDMCRAAQR